MGSFGTIALPDSGEHDERQPAGLKAERYHEGGLTTQMILQGFFPLFIQEWGKRDE